MQLDQHWFTEIDAGNGAAFSLKIKGKVHSEKTPYQQLDIYETEHFGYLMTLDGLVMLTSRDNFIYHEMMTHPALLAHPDPKRVLIIGGGDCGSLHEVLKHPGIKSVDQVEIDERVTRVAEIYFPELCTSNQDARARFHFTDGIKWLQNTKQNYYDVIIIDSTDPIGPAVGLFSPDFYRQCRQALGENGILIAQSESPLFHVNIIRDMTANLAEAGFGQIKTMHFPQCSYPSGWWSATLAGNTPSLTTTNQARLTAIQAELKYYNAAQHSAAMALPEFLSKTLANPAIN